MDLEQPRVCQFAGAYSEQFSLMSCAQTAANVYASARRGDVPSDEETIALDACKKAASYLELVPPCSSQVDPVQPGQFITKNQVLLIDASGIVHNETPLHGGGAYSDIYKWAIGTVIWQIIRDNSRAW